MAYLCDVYSKNKFSKHFNFPQLTVISNIFKKFVTWKL